MAVDESRTGVVGEDRSGRVGGGVGSRDGVGEEGRDVRESGWVGGSGSDSASARDRAREEMMERAKERRESVGAIEQEMVSARVEKAGGKTESPVSSLTNSPNVSRDGNAPAEHASSKGSLTALPTENWKVFRGSREIQPYQPSQRKGGEWKPGSVWGKVRRSSIR